MNKFPETWAKYAKEQLAKNLLDERQAADEVCCLLDQPDPDVTLIKAASERFW